MPQKNTRESTFAEILREKMTRSHGLTEQKVRQSPSENAVFSSEKCTYLNLENLYFTLNIDVFRSEKRDFTLYKSEKSKFPPPPPPPRNWSEAQKIALNSLISLGAKELNDCSTDQQIKKAFRRLAKTLHPDVAGATSPAQAFIMLHASYKALIKK